MNLRYCVKCEEIYFCGDIPCPVCRKKLYYFGREKVVLSPAHILFEYDKKHPYNPLNDYKGIYYIDTFSPEVNSSILECEDVLKHNPEEPNALFYLSTSFFSRGEFAKARDYLERLVALEPLDARPYKHLADIHMEKGEVDQAITQYQKAIEFDPKNWQIFDALGRAYLKQDRTKKALSAFVKACTFCKDPDRQKSIKKIIKQISTNVASTPE